MTKGKSRSYARRKLRQATKNVNIDFGSRISNRHINYGYGTVASQHELKNKPHQNLDDQE